MFLLLIQWLEKSMEHPVLHAFTYTSTRLILACFTTITLTLVLGPWFIKKIKNFCQPIRDIKNDNGFLLGTLHKSKKTTPMMGGVLILSSIFISAFLWMDLTSPGTILLCLSTLILGILGFVDDARKLLYQNHKGVSATAKLIIQFLVAFGVICYLQIPSISGYAERKLGIKPIHVNEYVDAPTSKKQLSLREFSSRIYLPCVRDPIYVATGLGIVALWIFLSFTIVGASNAVNLSDGLDGLAPGLIIFVAASLSIVAFVSNHQAIADYLHILYIEGSGEIAIYLAAVCGSCLGFLWYNSHPAELFMGDVGSLPLGGILGVSAVLLRKELFLALVGMVFVSEALSVIIQVLSYRFRNKKRVFLCAPLHHHFEYMGWAESKVVIRFWIVGFMLLLLGLLTLKVQ